MVVPVRTCVGCRRRDAQENLVRLALWTPETADGRLSGGREPGVVPDPTRRMPGRGAWLHPERECCESAVKRRALNRAFRREVDHGRLSCEALAELSLPR